MRSLRKLHPFKCQYGNLENFLPKNLRGEARIWLIIRANLIKTFEEFDKHEFYEGRDIVNVFCPQIIISIKKFRSLKDNVSCIDETYCTHIMQSVNNCDLSMIPVDNLKISTVTSQRSLPFKRQILIPIEIGGEEYDLKLYVVPNLSKLS